MFLYMQILVWLSHTSSDMKQLQYQYFLSTKTITMSDLVKTPVISIKKSSLPSGKHQHVQGGGWVEKKTHLDVDIIVKTMNKMNQQVPTLSFVSWTVRELEFSSIVIISSSFFAISFLFSGLLRTCSKNTNYQKKIGAGKTQQKCMVNFYSFVMPYSCFLRLLYKTHSLQPPVLDWSSWQCNSLKGSKFHSCHGVKTRRSIKTVFMRHTTTLILATLLALSLSTDKLLSRLFSGSPRDLFVSLAIWANGSESSKLLPWRACWSCDPSYMLGNCIEQLVTQEHQLTDTYTYVHKLSQIYQQFFYRYNTTNS